MSDDLAMALPHGWTKPPVYARYSIQLGKMLDEKRIVGTHLAPYLRNVDVQWESINTIDLPVMDFSEEDRKHYALKEGDLLICEGGEVGRTAIWRGELNECFFQKAVHRLRPKNDQDEPRYFRYFMRMAVDAGIFTLRNASTIAHLTAEQLRVVRFPAPPRERQSAIADHLDRETARIDALIAAKERVLGLLAERRRALITRAVTWGLEPDAPLRDSGIPALGEIPAHWGIVRLRFLSHLIEQGWSPQAESREPAADEWGVLKLNAVTKGRFDESAAKALPANVEPIRSLEVRAGDCLVTRSNTPTLVGDVCFVESTRPRLMLCDLIYRLALRSDLIDGRFLVRFLLLPVGRGQIESDARGTSASMVKISQQHIKDWQIPLPPLKEQKEIVMHLARVLAPLERVQDLTERTLALLRERRSTLIAAVVTGQISLGAA